MPTVKENYIRALNHQKPYWVPDSTTGICRPGFSDDYEKGPIGGGYDAFGVRWVCPNSGAGAPIPAPGEFLLKDITEWNKVVKFPDVDAIDWRRYADTALINYDKETQFLEFGSGNGPYERLGALMGFEEALIAMYEEPEAAYDLIGAITDYKIKVAEKVAKYYKADAFTIYDDIATEQHPFMAPETYRNLIKPHHKRLFDAVRNLGMYPIQHTCGKADMLIEDFIEAGAQAWSAVQPTNDIEGILQKYGDRFTIIGGYNTNGAPGYSMDEEIIRAEVRRCYDTYGKYNSYIFFGFLLVNSSDPNARNIAMIPMADEAVKYGRKLAGIA
ncbi:methylcobalamin:coenzyme M methyltransferase [Oxobacter pfennigii]|uniref:Methylcobalamin:coenzyme M methyltransferase n=1 Tax=Oxobacter pfennigii TaxID=36849 RepID=A0A0P8WB23_9CLOT|nr:uroporphyrinogen decarboxylase family protein [Oxobacter pfennigii]KPU45844.1 methylcobalamin:coenzyme M methyltransferase [Oxobacter pfennigii]